MLPTATAAAATEKPEVCFDGRRSPIQMNTTDLYDIKKQNVHNTTMVLNYM